MTLCFGIQRVASKMCFDSTVTVKTGARTAQVPMLLQSSSRLFATFRGRGPEGPGLRKEARDDGR
jgi:hypothetical protein